MSYSYQISKQSVYQDYLNLDDRSYAGIIRFFERNESDIHQLDFWEYFELYAAYCQSLFESGNYKHYLRHCDWLIEKSIEENVQYNRGLDVYEDSVFRKAASLYNLDRPVSSFIIATELIKIDAKNETYALLAKLCYLKEINPKRIAIKFISAVNLLLCSILIGYELLFLEMIGSDHLNTVQIIRSILFISGIVILASSEFYFRLTAYFKVRKIRRL